LRRRAAQQSEHEDRAGDLQSFLPTKSMDRRAARISAPAQNKPGNYRRNCLGGWRGPDVHLENRRMGALRSIGCGELEHHARRQRERKAVLRAQHAMGNHAQRAVGIHAANGRRRSVGVHVHRLYAREGEDRGQAGECRHVPQQRIIVPESRQSQRTHMRNAEPHGTEGLANGEAQP